MFAGEDVTPELSAVNSVLLSSASDVWHKLADNTLEITIAKRVLDKFEYFMTTLLS